MLKKEVFEKIGLFDESFPVCEDYDFWLRAARIYPIYLIDKCLIVKRAKFPDQLSFRYWGMDKFRIKALKKLLKEEISDEIRKEAMGIIKEKKKILVTGSIKRYRYFPALWYWLRF
jgi:GT2 family glycosyltransferase